MEVDMLF
jgi:hypothetical protein